MTLDDYFEIYKDMLSDVLGYRKIGYKLNNNKIIEASDHAIALYEVAIKSKTIEIAEMYYNEIRCQLFVCEETADEIGYVEDDDD